jgi:uncharacterized protein YdcH (DUF465 family)
MAPGAMGAGGWERADVMSDTEETRRLLLQSSEVFRQLSADHHSLDDRLKTLIAKPYLTTDEQLEETRLKKEKLRVKDQMEALVRRHQSAASGLPA